MTFRPRTSFLLWSPAVVALAMTACAHEVTVERRQGGVIYLKCEASLQNCLNVAEEVCQHDRFTVLRAYDQHDWKGGKQQSGSYGPHIEIRKSEAYVRCGYHGSWGPDVDLMRKSDLCPVPDEPDRTPRPVLPPPNPPATSPPPAPPVPSSPDGGLPPVLTPAP